MGDLKQHDKQCLSDMDTLVANEDMGDLSREQVLSSQCGLNEELVRDHIANTPLPAPETPTLDAAATPDIPPVAFTSSGTVGGEIPGGEPMTQEEWAHYKNPWPKISEDQALMIANPGAAAGAAVSGMVNGTHDIEAMRRAMQAGATVWDAIDFASGTNSASNGMKDGIRDDVGEANYIP